MEESLESATVKVQKVDLNRFPLTKYSRWMDQYGHLFVLTGFYHGKDPAKPFSNGSDRLAIDLLDVAAERADYMPIGRFIHYIIDGQLMPWKEQKGII